MGWSLSSRLKHLRRSRARRVLRVDRRVVRPRVARVRSPNPSLNPGPSRSRVRVLRLSRRVVQHLARAHSRSDRRSLRVPPRADRSRHARRRVDRDRAVQRQASLDQAVRHRVEQLLRAQPLLGRHRAGRRRARAPQRRAPQASQLRASPRRPRRHQRESRPRRVGPVLLRRHHRHGRRQRPIRDRAPTAARLRVVPSIRVLRNPARA